MAARLEAQGFEIVDFNVRVGRLEIDVIARRGSLVVICEVRTRRSDRWGSPAETIDQRKLERLRRATAKWLRTQRLGPIQVRIDVAAVVVGQDGSEPSVHYYENASFPMRHIT